MRYQTFLIKFSDFLNWLGLRRLQRYIKIAFFRMVGFIFGSKAVALPDKKSISQILIVKQDHQMGDMLCTTPIFTALKEAFPQAEITLIAGEKNYQVVRHHPALAEVIFFNKLEYLASPKAAWRFLKILRQRPYDLGIVPATISVSVTSDLLCRLSGAKYRLGIKKLDGVENPTSFLFNLPVEVDWRDSAVHQSLRNLEILKKIGIDDHPPVLSLGILPEEEAKAQAFFEQHRGNGELVIGIHPGAGKKMNLWGAEKFAEIADRLTRDYAAKIIITCGPDDNAVVDKMMATMTEKTAFVVNRDFSIREVGALLKYFNLYITNDTGTMHLASAVGVPSLSLFGATEPEQWAPLGKQHRYLVSSDGDVRSIPVDAVYQTAREMLSKIH